MPTTTVYNTADYEQTLTFTLPPAQAVVAAYEQSLKNYNTWNYPQPTTHPKFKSAGDVVRCGTFWAKNSPLRGQRRTK